MSRIITRKPAKSGLVMTSWETIDSWYCTLYDIYKQEGQRPLTGQRAANFRLVANQWADRRVVTQWCHGCRRIIIFLGHLDFLLTGSSFGNLTAFRWTCLIFSVLSGRAGVGGVKCEHSKLAAAINRVKTFGSIKFFKTYLFVAYK